MDRKKGLLILLLALWGGILFYRVLFNEGPRRAPMKYVKGAVQPVKKEGGDSQGKIETELLDQAPPPQPGEVRNIFAPLPSPKPPPPPKPAPVLPPPSLPKPPEPLLPPPPVVRAPTPEELALAQARTELAEIRYLGFLDRGNGKQEGFFTRKQETVIGEKGSVLFGHFQIRELSSTVAVIVENNTHAEVTLQLSEGKNDR